MTDTEHMSWSEAIRAYQTTLQAVGRSPSTIRVHLHYVRMFAKQAASPRDLRLEDIEAAFASTTWMPETRKSARSVARVFCQWAVKRGVMVEDVAAGLLMTHVPQALPRPTPQRVVDRLIAATRGRERWLVLLAAHGGLRCCEIALVHRDDLLDGNILTVVGKGGKQRLVPLVDEDLAYAIRSAEGDGWLFPGRVNGHLSPGHVTRLLSEILPGKWTAHTLRHRAATNGYARTRDLLAVGQMLGHSKAETTQRYVQVPFDAVLAVAQGAAAPDRRPLAP